MVQNLQCCLREILSGQIFAQLLCNVLLNSIIKIPFIAIFLYCCFCTILVNQSSLVVPMHVMLALLHRD